MKRIYLACFSLFLVLGSLQAQEGKKALKQASKNLGNYNLDPQANSEKLYAAVDLINTAFESEEVSSQYKAWITKGQIFSALANNEVNKKYQDPSYELAYPMAASDALDSFGKVISESPKKGEVKDALKGLLLLESTLNNFGIMSFQAQDYDGAYANFGKAKAAYDIVKGAGSDSSFDLPGAMSDLNFYQALSGFYGANRKATKPLFESLLAAGDAKPSVYDALYNLNSEDGNDEAALKMLQEGRAKYPDDKGLLYAEINHMLKLGKLQELVTKLEKAAEAEPENASVLSTLGNVFDRLSAQEAEAGNTEKSEEHFDKALAWYDKTLAVDENDFVALYSVGTMYYNRGAALVEDLNASADDLSAAGNKRYNDIKAEMDGLFDKALPYFVKCETVNPQDSNTMLALKEMYARKNDFDKVNEYKAKLEALK